MTSAWSAWSVGLVACLGTFCVGQETVSTPPALPVAPVQEPVRVSLVAECEGLLPGRIALMGVRFQIAPGWHIYWNGLNDSGLPPMLHWQVPDDYEIGPVMWPAPRRHILGDRDLLDHVLEGDVLGIVPIRVPKTARPGDRVRIGVQADWLACQAACIPGKANLSIELPVLAPQIRKYPGVSAPLFEGAMSRIPRIWTPASGVHLAWFDRTLVVTTTPGTRMEFYPHADSAPITDCFDGAVSDTGTLRLRVGEGARLIGVLRLHAQTSRPEAILGLNLPIGSLQQAPDTPRLGWLDATGTLDFGVIDRRSSNGNTRRSVPEQPGPPKDQN